MHAYHVNWSMLCWVLKGISLLAQQLSRAHKVSICLITYLCVRMKWLVALMKAPGASHRCTVPTAGLPVGSCPTPAALAVLLLLLLLFGNSS